MDIKSEIDNLNDEINKAKQKINLAQHQIEELRDKCKHEDITTNLWGTADCNICKKHFSWYCPTSPTLECNYEQKDGSYDEDCCKYCGEPEERK